MSVFVLFRPMTNIASTRWILAFDSSCGSCRQIARTVAQACDGRLEVLPLNRPEVAGWRAEALGPDAPWAPTLLRVRDGGTRAWTKRGMAVPLLRCLGPKATLGVLRALGQLRAQEVAETSSADASGDAITRHRFLRLGTGALCAGGLVLAGRVPAYAADAGTRWVRANHDKLPETYAQVTALPMEVRRAVLQASSPAVRSRLWTEQLTRYRQTHPQLTAEQRRVLDHAVSLAADPSTFTPEGRPRPEQAAELRRQAQEAFGPDQARRLFATFGADTADTSPQPRSRGCTCSTSDDWCENETHCDTDGCMTTNGGCGWFHGSDCNGLCVN
jgi:hypothetical protein